MDDLISTHMGCDPGTPCGEVVWVMQLGAVSRAGNHVWRTITHTAWKCLDEVPSNFGSALSPVQRIVWMTLAELKTAQPFKSRWE